MKALTIRVPQELHERIEQDAKANERSYNAQVLYILKRRYAAHDDVESGKTQLDSERIR